MQKQLLYMLLLLPSLSMAQLKIPEKVIKSVVVFKSDSLEFVTEPGNYIFDPNFIKSTSIIKQENLDKRFGSGVYNKGMTLYLDRNIKFINLQQLLDLWKIDQTSRNFQLFLDNRPTLKNAIFVIDPNYVRKVIVKKDKLYVYRKRGKAG